MHELEVQATTCLALTSDTLLLRAGDRSMLWSFEEKLCILLCQRTSVSEWQQYRSLQAQSFSVKYESLAWKACLPPDQPTNARFFFFLSLLNLGGSIRTSQLQKLCSIWPKSKKKRLDLSPFWKNTTRVRSRISKHTGGEQGKLCLTRSSLPAPLTIQTSSSRFHSCTEKCHGADLLSGAKSLFSSSSSLPLALPRQFCLAP